MLYRPSSASGLTLIEVVVAVLVLAIVALGASTQLSSGNPGKLELAASELAAAIRFARSEAMRTSEVHAISVDETSETFTVEKIDLSTSPATVESVLYHPIAKQPYRRNFDKNPVTRGVVIDNAVPVFVFEGLAAQQRVMFTAAGVPVFVDTVGNSSHRLLSGQIRLDLAALGRDVLLQPITGRVTVQ